MRHFFRFIRRQRLSFVALLLVVCGSVWVYLPGRSPSSQNTNEILDQESIRLIRKPISKNSSLDMGASAVVAHDEMNPNSTALTSNNGQMHFEHSIPILIMACDRPAVERCINSVLRYRPSPTKFPIIVSQDCQHDQTAEAIGRFGDKIIHIKQPDRSIPEIDPDHGSFLAYYRIARHYKWAFDYMFQNLNHKQLVVIEDDMEIAPDFFQYFESFLPVLRSDSSLMCVSAWNDNGKGDNALDPAAFYRSDFFPGLGWMILQELWSELRIKWPRSFWDDWLRNPENRRGRQCIRPEISRVLNFGKFGASNGEFFDDHIGKIKVNKEMVTYVGYDPKTLMLSNNPKDAMKRNPRTFDVRDLMKQNYDKKFLLQVYELSSEISDRRLAEILEATTPRDFEEFRCNRNLLRFDGNCSQKPIADADTAYCGPNCMRRFRIPYRSTGSAKEFNQISTLRRWGLMEDIRPDVARTSYLGIVTFKARQHATNEILIVHSAPVAPSSKG